MYRDLLGNDSKTTFNENDFWTLNEIAIEHKRKIKPANRRWPPGLKYSVCYFLVTKVAIVFLLKQTIVV